MCWKTNENRLLIKLLVLSRHIMMCVVQIHDDLVACSFCVMSVPLIGAVPVMD